MNEGEMQHFLTVWKWVSGYRVSYFSDGVKVATILIANLKQYSYSIFDLLIYIS